MATGTGTTMDSEYCLFLEIECAHLTKQNSGSAGLRGKIHPFVEMQVVRNPTTTNTNIFASGNMVKNCTDTQWDSSAHPNWSHSCPGIPLSNTSSQTLLRFTVFADSEWNRYPGFLPDNDPKTFLSGVISKTPKPIGHVEISIHDILERPKDAPLELHDDKGTVIGTLCVHAVVRSGVLPQQSSTTPSTVTTTVDPAWFVSPVEPFLTSGGTAAFFQLQLTPEGMAATGQTSPSFYVGKDLSHAADEKDFYQQLLQLPKDEDVAILRPFMFQYLGILESKSSNGGGSHQLLVLQNLRNNYQSFRMLDLKIGDVISQAGWKGKSRLHALKCHLVNDPLTNSASEGYRLAGFDGSCPAFDSLDPLIDFLAVHSNNNNNSSSSHTILGTEIDASHMKMAKRAMINLMSGTEVLGYFVDVHMDPAALDVVHTIHDRYTPVEMVEVVFREVVARLVRVSAACHAVQVPQKWIGSSLALGYDAGLLPDRGCSVEDAEEAIRSKVIVNLLDWGRSELLTSEQYQSMTAAQKSDRKQFWRFYEGGIDRLTFNTARSYYHHFTNEHRWTKVILQVMDFDSTTKDDFIGKIEIQLPDPYDARDAAATLTLQRGKTYSLLGSRKASLCGSTLDCSISWLEFPSQSRLLGTWRVSIEKANNLPVMDITNSSDPYCLVIAQSDGGGRQLHQRTCVKARCLNPVWNETIELPVMKPNGSTHSLLSSAMALKGPLAQSKEEMVRFFQWDDGQHDTGAEQNALKEFSQLIASSARQLADLSGSQLRLPLQLSTGSNPKLSDVANGS